MNSILVMNDMCASMWFTYLLLYFHKVIEFDPAKEPLSKIKQYKKKIDLIFNALHGKDGEDGIIQSYFEFFKIPYTHSGIISSMNSMDKIISKQIFKKNNILTPNHLALNAVNFKKKFIVMVNSKF